MESPRFTSPDRTPSAIADWPVAELIDDATPHSGLFNMAFDAALLELGFERDFSLVRVYEWSEPTVTTGYFQTADSAQRSAADAADSRSDDESSRSRWSHLPHVRRLSGGGAILHDREVTYSIVLPANHPVTAQPSELYRLIHRALIRLLAECGIIVHLRSETSDFESKPGPVVATEPFLCFLRHDGNDLVHSSGPKLVGSAQRRRKGVVLQHGSILLQRSKHSPEVAGILDLAPSFQAGTFRARLGEILASTIAPQWHSRSISGIEQEAVSRQLSTAIEN